MKDFWVTDLDTGMLRVMPSAEKAKETAAMYRDGKALHLVEAREQVWVVRDQDGKFVSAHADEVDAMEMLDEFNPTCRQEWLGGGA